MLYHSLWDIFIELNRSTRKPFVSMGLNLGASELGPAVYGLSESSRIANCRAQRDESASIFHVAYCLVSLSSDRVPEMMQVVKQRTRADHEP